jgi:polysaccharide export outer membrane protein
VRTSRVKSQLDRVRRAAAIAALVAVASPVFAQAPPMPAPGPAKPAAPAPQQQVPAGVPLPAGYVIGPEDVLNVVFWRDADMSSEVVVRPDGMVTLPLLKDVPASGLTPEQLAAKVTTEATKFMQDPPTVTVVVKTINSRKVFISGMVGKPGHYALTGPMTVLQLIAVAGGLHEFADAKNISIIRNENGRQISYPFNYRDIVKRKSLKQNIELKPGDTVIVP